MAEAAKALVGTHDFKSYQTTGSSRLTTERTVYDILVERHGADLTSRVIIEVEANGFLYNMVRNIAGTLVQIGKGLAPVSFAAEALAARDRRAAGMTAPPEGLFLIGVEYDGADDPADASCAFPGETAAAELLGPINASRPHHHPHDRRAQENTLFNCRDLIELHGDELVSLITGPSLGPEGDLLQQQSGTDGRSERAGGEIPTLCRAIDSWRDQQSYFAIRGACCGTISPMSCTRTVPTASGHARAISCLVAERAGDCAHGSWCAVLSISTVADADVLSGLRKIRCGSMPLAD